MSTLLNTYKRERHRPWKPGCGGDVYLIKSENGLYKIGHSENCWNRIKALRPASPVELELFTWACLKKPYDRGTVEKELHKIYKNRRVRYEWFSLTDEDLSNIIDLFVEIDHDNEFWQYVLHLNLFLPKAIHNKQNGKPVPKRTIPKEKLFEEIILD
jgi:hypothetical protein